MYTQIHSTFCDLRPSNARRLSTTTHARTFLLLERLRLKKSLTIYKLTFYVRSFATNFDKYKSFVSGFCCFTWNFTHSHASQILSRFSWPFFPSRALSLSIVATLYVRLDWCNSFHSQSARLSRFAQKLLCLSFSLSLSLAAVPVAFVCRTRNTIC